MNELKTASLCEVIYHSATIVRSLSLCVHCIVPSLKNFIYVTCKIQML